MVASNGGNFFGSGGGAEGFGFALAAGSDGLRDEHGGEVFALHGCGLGLGFDATGAPVTGGAQERLDGLKAEWAQRKAELQAITTTQIEAINAWARDKGISYVTTPAL